MWARRRLLFLLLGAGGWGLAAAFLGAGGVGGGSRCRPGRHWGQRQRQPQQQRHDAAGGRHRSLVVMMSEAVVGVGSGRFQPDWPAAGGAAGARAAASIPLGQKEEQQPAPAPSRFRRPSPTAASTAATAPRGRPAPAIPSQLRIVLTGFGPFHGVADNPAEALARRVGAAVTTDQEEQADAPFALSSSVVETSAGGAAEGLASIHRGLEREGLGGDDNLLFVHLGVRNDIEGFRLESVGYNEADFSVPDQRDFQPRGQAVSTTDDDTSHLLFSTLPLQSIMRSLHAQQGYSRTDVAISTDPGRFCCNYLYFRSLEYCRNRGPNTAALFVHLPPFSRVPSDDQFAFLHHLLSTAAAHFPHVGQTPGLLS